MTITIVIKIGYKTYTDSLAPKLLCCIIEQTL